MSTTLADVHQQLLTVAVETVHFARQRWEVILTNFNGKRNKELAMLNQRLRHEANEAHAILAAIPPEVGYAVHHISPYVSVCREVVAEIQTVAVNQAPDLDRMDALVDLLNEQFDVLQQLLKED